jgi:cell division protein FtsB
MRLAGRLKTIDPVARARALRLGFWVLAGSLLFNLMLGDMGVVQGLRQRRVAARLRAEVAALQSENDALSADVKALNSDPFRIEALAREDIGLARPGEIIFLFPPDGTRRDASATAGRR